MARSALEGLRVLELSGGTAASLSAMFLADFGAEVVKVEPHGGSLERDSPGFAVWNRNKHSLVVDPAVADDSSRLAALLAGADVCLCSARVNPFFPAAGTLEAALATNPAIILLEMPPAPGEAPWAGGAESNELLAALSGLSLRQYSDSGAPVDPVESHLLYIQGIWGAATLAAALLARRREGVGRHLVVDGLHGAMVASPGSFILDPLEAEEAPSGAGGRNPFYSRYRCADGSWLFLAALTQRFQERAVELLGIEDVAADPRLGGDLAAAIQPDNRGWVRARIAAVFASRSRRDWVELLESGGCPVGELLEREQWLDHPQIGAIDMAVELEDPERGHVVMPGQPLALEGTPATIRHAAPRLDEHGALDWPAKAAPLARPSGEALLSHLRILDLGTILAGPFAGSLLSDLGADVVKVEPPDGDPFRRFGFVYNRGMRSLAVDLRDERGRAAFLEAVRGADAVIDNYRPGVLEQFRLRHEDLREVNPEIVSFTIMGFGKQGPLSSKLGFDPVLQSMSGMMLAQGGDDEPVYLHIPVNDVATAPLTVLGCCLALWARAEGSGGQGGWTSLAGVSALMQSAEIVRFAGRAAARRGGRDYPGPGPLDRYYRAADGWLRLQASGRPGALAAVLGLDAATLEDEEAAVRALRDAIAERPRAELLVDLARAGLPAASARTRSELADVRRLLEADVLVAQRREGLPDYLLPDRFSRVSGGERRAPLTPPGLGEHSRAVLREAGLSEEQLDALFAASLLVEQGPMNYQAGSTYK